MNAIITLPVVCEDLEKALTCLGGRENVQRSVEQKSALQCNLRAEDPYHHPVSSSAPERVDNQFLLSVGEDDKDGHCTVIRPINESYKFDRLADFQFLAPDALLLKSRNENETWIDYLQHESLHLPPIQFSRYDVPRHFDVTKRQQESTGRISRFHLVNMSEPTPCVPLENAIRSNENALAQAMENEMKQKFEERPIWLRHHVSRQTCRGLCVALNKLSVLS